MPDGRSLGLAKHTHRPEILTDLYAMCGQATALMASSAFDLNCWDQSDTIAKSAISYASLAGHASLQAWTHGLAALLANWRREPDIALSHFQRGMGPAPLYRGPLLRAARRRRICRRGTRRSSKRPGGRRPLSGLVEHRGRRRIRVRPRPGPGMRRCCLARPGPGPRSSRIGPLRPGHPACRYPGARCPRSAEPRSTWLPPACSATTWTAVPRPSGQCSHSQPPCTMCHWQAG